MSVEFLSLILIIIAALGICGLSLIFWHHKNSFKKPAEASEIKKEYAPVENRTTQPAKSRIDPTISSLGFSALDVLQDDAESNVATKPVKAPHVVTLHESPSPPTAQPSTISTNEKNKQVIVIYLLASAQQPFVGYELFQSILSAGLRFGKMNIFHYHSPNDEILFSLASAVEPGVFDLANIGGISCPGLSIFMSTANVPNPAAIFELMLATAQQLTEDLGGQLYDENHQPLHESIIALQRSRFATP